ncbi:hypothetical protein J2X69_004177 [Algoriphagus sp. 4150]|nr:hypothetical protein [Algoriphagus sp. 4150]
MEGDIFKSIFCIRVTGTLMQVLKSLNKSCSKKTIVYAALAFCFFRIDTVKEQEYETENIILITLDRLRWQEVFK